MTTADHVNDTTQSVPLAAVKHKGSGEIDDLITRVAHELVEAGYKVGGAVQSNDVPPGDCRCDMALEELTSGEVIPISQDLGKASDGCRLNDVALDRVVGLVESSIEPGLDILVLNKFGKQESEGRGMRSAIAGAVSQGVPVLVGLNEALADAWAEFSGGEGRFLDADPKAIEAWLGDILSKS